MIKIILRLLAGIDLLIWGILFFIKCVKTIDELKGHMDYLGTTIAKFGLSLILILAAVLQLEATVELM